MYNCVFVCCKEVAVTGIERTSNGADHQMVDLAGFLTLQYWKKIINSAKYIILPYAWVGSSFYFWPDGVDGVCAGAAGATAAAAAADAIFFSFSLFCRRSSLLPAWQKILYCTLTTE